MTTVWQRAYSRLTPDAAAQLDAFTPHARPTVRKFPAVSWLIGALVALSCQPATPAASGPLAITGAAADDTAEIQAAIDRGGTVYLPAGTFEVHGLHGNASIVGEGRDVTILEGSDILTITGTSQPSTYELAHGPHIEGVSFEGTGTAIRFEGVAYFDVSRSSFSGFDTALDFAGSLQVRVDDVLFTHDRTGIAFHPAPVAYYSAAPNVPPNRVEVTWSTFYYSAFRAIDFSGGQQFIVRDSEFGDNGTSGDAQSAAIWVEGAGDPVGPGLVADTLWMEANHGLAAIVLRGPVIHTIRDSWFAYTDATSSIDATGSTLVCDNVRMDALHTVTAVLGGSC